MVQYFFTFLFYWVTFFLPAGKPIPQPKLGKQVDRSEGSIKTDLKPLKQRKLVEVVDGKGVRATQEAEELLRLNEGGQSA